MPKPGRRNQHQRPQPFGMQRGKGRGNRAAHGIPKKREIPGDPLILEQFF